jgi:hypothetical protein
VEQFIIAQIPFTDYSFDTVLQSLGGNLSVCLEKVGYTAGQVCLGSYRSENVLGKLEKFLLALVDGHTQPAEHDGQETALTKGLDRIIVFDRMINSITETIVIFLLQTNFLRINS